MAIRLVVPIFFVCISMLLGGCAGKAQALNVATTQFETDSLTAIDGLGSMMEAETAPPRRSEAEANQEFVDLIVETDEPITGDLIDIALDPDAVALDPAVLERRAALLDDMRTQYRSFARIFARLEEGSLFASSIVSDAEPFATRLTAQMLSCAQSVADNPPVLLQLRHDLELDIQILHGKFEDGVNPSGDRQRRALARYGLAVAPGQPLTEDEKRRGLAAWKGRWEAVLREEHELARHTIEQCLKAATIGIEVRKQIVAYDQVSAQDVGEALRIALEIAGSFTGQDLSGLEAEVNDAIATAEADPALKSVMDQILMQINEARQVH